MNYWIRFRYLNQYTQLKEPPLPKVDAQELHPDVNTPDQPPDFHNYLDEFLQAVRIFGFLEKPVSVVIGILMQRVIKITVAMSQVFHELARHLQTRRLIAGDSLSLDQDNSFYCVIDGSVQVFGQTGRSKGTPETSGLWNDEDMNGYQLLNQVGPGGTLSSLFTILSLFTENVKISWQDGDTTDEATETASTTSSTQPHVRSRARRSDSDVSHIDLESLRSRERSASVSSSGSTVHGNRGTSSSFGGHLPTQDSRNGPRTFTHSPLRASASTSTTETHSHYGVVARATEDSTLAVIPAEAFKRLTRKFPKATAHIVQGIE